MDRNSSAKTKITEENKNKQNKIKDLGFLREKSVKTPSVILKMNEE